MTFNKLPRSDNSRFWTPLRMALTAVVLSLIAFGGLSSCTSADEKPVANQPGTSSGTTAPPRTVPNNPPPANAILGLLPSNIREAKLKTVNGSTITLGDYSGKVLLVNLWATWCGPCRSETPELVKLHKEFQAQGVEMVGLSTEDPEGSAELVKNFVREFQVDYKIGWGTAEVLGALNEVEPQRDAIPQSYIISRDGHILKKFVGFNQFATPPQIRQAITDALNYKG